MIYYKGEGEIPNIQHMALSLIGRLLAFSDVTGNLWLYDLNDPERTPEQWSAFSFAAIESLSFIEGDFRAIAELFDKVMVNNVCCRLFKIVRVMRHETVSRTVYHN